MAFDYTTFTEVDEDGLVTYTSTSVTFAGIASRQKDYYAYKDMGVDFFNEYFEFNFDFNVSSAVNTAIVCLFSVQNIAGDIYDVANGSSDSIHVSFYQDISGVCSLRVHECYAGNTVLDSCTASKATDYYLKIKRDETIGSYGRVYLYVYSDSDRTTLIDTLSLDLREKKDFRYLLALSGYNNEAGDAGTITGTVNNLEQIVTLVDVPVFTSSNSLTATVTPFWVESEPFLAVNTLSATMGLSVAAEPLTSTGSMACAGVPLDPSGWSTFISSIKHKVAYRYYFTLTGDADGVDDVEIPISSMQARYNQGNPTYFEVNIPYTSTHADYITDRPNGEMVVSQAFFVSGEELVSLEFIVVDFENVNITVGDSITLSGHRTMVFTPQEMTLTGDVFHSTKDGKHTFKFADIDNYLRPGDSLTVGDDTITVGSIIYTISVSDGGGLTHSMEVQEIPDGYVTEVDINDPVSRLSYQSSVTIITRPLWDSVR